MYCLAQRRADSLELVLHGPWRATTLPAIQAELAANSLSGVQVLKVRGADASLDLSGAWLLQDFLDRVAGAGITVQWQEPIPPAVALVAKSRPRVNPEGAHPVETSPLGASVGRHPLASAPGSTSAPGLDSSAQWLDPAAAVEGLGRRTVGHWRLLDSMLEFLGRVGVSIWRAGWQARRWRPTSIARHVYDTGITAIPIVALIAFLIAVILAYMGAQQLRKFGADIFVVDLVTVGVLRELAVLLTAIIVAGRSGSAFAAELGAMQLNEEVDALQAIGVDPIEVLVLPRLLGLVIALPLLTIIADGIGLVGGGLLCRALLGMPLVQFINRAHEAIAATTFWAGLMKAPVFAVLIALSGTWCGLRVRGSSRELGRLTTLAVVQAIFLVIFADALFAILFMTLNI